MSVLFFAVTTWFKRQISRCVGYRVLHIIYNCKAKFEKKQNCPCSLTPPPMHRFHHIFHLHHIFLQKSSPLHSRTHWNLPRIDICFGSQLGRLSAMLNSCRDFKRSFCVHCYSSNRGETAVCIHIDCCHTGRATSYHLFITCILIYFYQCKCL